jgi:hypothetical protein
MEREVSMSSIMLGLMLPWLEDGMGLSARLVCAANTLGADAIRPLRAKSNCTARRIHSNLGNIFFSGINR